MQDSVDQPATPGPTIDVVALLVRALDADPVAIEAAAVTTIIGAVLPPGRNLVWRLAARDGWCCTYCDRALGWGHPDVLPPEIEHRIPKTKGGTNHPSNLCLSCRECNAEKGTLTEAEFSAHRAYRHDSEGFVSRPDEGNACPWPRLTIAEHLAEILAYELEP